jgi:shikimate dehydrogenase
MHAAAFAALGIPATYTAIRAGTRELAALLPGVARAGGTNLTHPLKQAALAAVDEARGWAARLSVCNTVHVEAGRVIGDNTDVAGIAEAARELGVGDGPWLIIGTGASARAAVAAASLRGSPVAVRSRQRERAAAFLRWATTLTEIAAAEGEWALVVRAVPAGVEPGSALDEVNGQAVAALDLTYARGETPWVRTLRAHGIRAADGRAVLVGQGAAALERWFPGVVPPIDVMRRAVDAALA